MSAHSPYLRSRASRFTRGSDEGFYAFGAEPTARGQHRNTVAASNEVPETDHAHQRKEPTPLPGSGSAGDWGVW